MVLLKPVKKLPKKMRDNIETARALIDAIELIERRYLLGFYTPTEYCAAMHKWINTTRSKLST
jgi:hypothetical protein